MASLSRMEKLEEQQNMRRVGAMAVITVCIIVVVLMWGIPLMIKLATWLGNRNPSGNLPEKTDLIPPSPPRIFLAYEATNSATQRISGVAEPGTIIALGVNGEPVGNEITGDDGTWSFDRITLKEGGNDFFAVAVDPAGNKSNPSDTVTMRYLSKAPELTVDSPLDRQVVFGKTGVVEIKGTTTANGRLTVNERTIILTGSGKFATNYQLNEGENVLVLVVTDQSGNQTRRELVVEYRK